MCIIYFYLRAVVVKNVYYIFLLLQTVVVKNVYYISLLLQLLIIKYILVICQTVVMNNYASIGVDALVTLNFHKWREDWPGIFANRIINKVI